MFLTFHYIFTIPCDDKQDSVFDTLESLTWQNIKPKNC